MTTDIVGTFHVVGICSWPQVCSSGVILISSSERNELQKDIEQLCMHQAGPAYLGVATRLHFQRYNVFILLSLTAYN